MKYNYNEVTESELESVEFQEGNLYRTTDTGKFFLDPIGGGGTRILIGGDYCAYMDEQIRVLNMLPRFNVEISITDEDENAITGIYVNIYNIHDDGTKVLQDQILYSGTPISICLPKDFKYYIEPEEMSGYTVESQSGIIEQSVKLSFKYTKCNIYGVTWDKTASTVFARTDAAALFEEPKPYTNGSTDYGSPFDNCLPWSGMTVTQDSNAGTLVAIPKFWFKWTVTDTSISLQITSSEREGFSVSPAHRDRGDGKGERDVVYIGRYHCSSNNWKSESGVLPKVSETRASFRTNIHALGDTIYQNDYALFWTVRMLYLVEYANWDCQSAIGHGCGDNSAVGLMGYTDNMPYHTGTTLDNKTDYGLGTQYRNIEGLWDNCGNWCDGIYYNNTDVYCINNPNDFSDTTNGTLVCTRDINYGFISDWKWSTVDNFDWFMYPSAFAMSKYEYVADYCYEDSAGVVLIVGGSYYQNSVYGLFYLGGGYGASGAVDSVGARLMLIP